MSRPRRNYPEDVDKYVEEMISAFDVSQDAKDLTDYRLASLAKVSIDTVERWYNGEADKALQDDPDTTEDIKRKYIKAGYSDALKKLVAFRSQACISHIAQDRIATGWIFLSKQPHWGGFQDVQRGEQTVKADFRVTLTGPDGKTISG